MNARSQIESFRPMRLKNWNSHARTRESGAISMKAFTYVQYQTGTAHVNGGLEGVVQGGVDVTL